MAMNGRARGLQVYKKLCEEAELAGPEYTALDIFAKYLDESNGTYFNLARKMCINVTSLRNFLNEEQYEEFNDMFESNRRMIVDAAEHCCLSHMYSDDAALSLKAATTVMSYLGKKYYETQGPDTNETLMSIIDKLITNAEREDSEKES